MLVRTRTWDIVAWNRAATAVLANDAEISAAERNVLRRVFGNERVRDTQADWRGVARFVAAAFRADMARAGATYRAKALVDDLLKSSPEFATNWQSDDVVNHGGGTRHLTHALAGPLAREYSAFIVDGRPDLSMVVYNPATAADRARVAELLQAETQRRVA